ncbi:MAG: hypothetical protein IJ644_10625 [Oscillospiraceae bacterium]|nr:hypothetical protein [Oscillospiraceae bacterium]
MKMEQYQNIVVINITNGKYTNYWVYRADAVNPEKQYGADSLPIYLSALRQAITNPEVHKRGNGEDQHLYYIPMGSHVDLQKAKKIAFSKFYKWKQSWESMPAYVVKFVFRKKQDSPEKVELFRKKTDYDAKSAYLKAYHHSVFRPAYQVGNHQFIVYWHGNSIQQINEEVNALVFDRWKNPKLSNWL